MRRFFLVIIFMWFGGMALGQNLVIEGFQTIGSFSPELKSTPVVITSQATIVKVETNSSGFWLERAGKNFAQFSKLEGKFNPNPVGFVLPAGTYTAYPNLDDNQKQAYVKIYLSLKK